MPKGALVTTSGKQADGLLNMSNGPGINIQSAQALATSNTTLPEFNLNVSAVDDNVFPGQISTLIIRDAIVTHNCSASQDDLDDQNLHLHNSFDILGSEAENENGEALLGDTDILEVFEGLQDAARKSPNVVSEAAIVSPLEVVEVVSISGDEAPTSVEERPSKAVDPVTLLHWANTPVLTPLALPSNSVEPGDRAHTAAIDASVKVTLDNNTSHPFMPQPITTSCDSLTSDKLPSNQNLVPTSKPKLADLNAWRVSATMRLSFLPSTSPIADDCLSLTGP